MKKFANTILENGIIVSLALGAAYLFSYEYQEGILGTYGVPLEFIKIDIIDIVEIFVMLLGAFYITLLFFNGILNLFTGVTDYKLYNIVRWLLLYGVCAGVDILIFHKISKLSSMFGIVFLIYLVIELLSPLMCFREKISYKQKWLKHSEKLLEDDKKSVEEYNRGHFNNLRKNTGKFLVVIYIIYLLCLGFNLAGQQEAETKTEYYIADNYENKVVVYSTDEYYILMDFENEENKKVYQVVSVDDIGVLSLKEIEPFEKAK